MLKKILIATLVTSALVTLPSCKRKSGDGSSPQSAPTPSNTLSIEKSYFSSASADGKSGQLTANIVSKTTIEKGYLHLAALSSDGKNITVSTTPRSIAKGESAKPISIELPAQYHNQTVDIVAYLTRGIDDSLKQAIASKKITVNPVQQQAPTNKDIAAIKLSQQPRSYSYETQTADGISRGIHSFAVQVIDTDTNTSVGGLTAKHFSMLADGSEDTESPLSVNSAENSISIYLLVDVSSSIANADAEFDLRDAASRTVMSLSNNATFKYRQFSSRSSSINKLDELEFDAKGSISGTALYKALDDTLKQIIADTENNNNKIIIAFTDGDDRSSRNNYKNNDGSFQYDSHEAVRDFIGKKIAATKTQLIENNRGDLTTYFVGLGSAVSQPSLNTLASSGSGKLLHAADKDELALVFSKLSGLIQSTYYMRYNSQTEGKSIRLDLNVKLDNGVETSAEITK